MSGNNGDSPALAPVDGDDAFNAALVELEKDDGTPATAAGNDGQAPNDPPAGPASTSPAGDHGQAAGDPAPAGAPTDDVWKDVPEAARAQFEKLQRDFQAASGRLSAADKRANQLLQQLQQTSRQNGEQAPSDGSGQPTTPAGARAALESDDMKRLREDYPEIAAPITAALGAIAQQVESLAAPVQSLNEQHIHQETQARYDALAQHHPDWQQYSTDARWANFLAQAPQYVRDMHARNVDVSDPEEAADVLSRFKAFIGVTATPTPAPGPTPTPPAADPRRQRQLDAGRDGGSNGAGAAGTGIPDDFDAAVAAYAAKADAQNTRPIR